MWKLVSNLSLNVFFAFIVVVMSYGGRDGQSSYFYQNSLRQYYNGDWNHSEGAMWFEDVSVACEM